MKYKLTLVFDGSAFSGWQSQKNAPSVQAELTRCAKILFGSDASVTGSSRTDSGVHALGYVCHVTAEKEFTPDTVIMALNHNLDSHIAVIDCEIVPDDFHARYSTLSKEYHYVIYNSKIPDPFLISRVWFYPHKLDAERMNECAARLVGKHDFSAFMASGSKIVDTEREIYSAQVVRDGEKVVFKILGNGFLYNMVRIIAGTLVDIERGKISMTVDEIIQSRDRSNAGVTAPPEGLYLYRVNY